MTAGHPIPQTGSDTKNRRKGATDVCAERHPVDRYGPALGLSLYGALTFWSSLHLRPDPNTHFEAWSRYVTTDHYALTHVLGSGLGLILAIFGTFALGAYLATSRAGRLGPLAMVLTVFASALFLMPMGVSTSSAPRGSGVPGGQ